MHLLFEEVEMSWFSLTVLKVRLKDGISGTKPRGLINKIPYTYEKLSTDYKKRLHFFK